ncbi:MAG: class I SAM-dependent methyltransferase, partial [Atribacterota bacterium]|nr:class I SAM-dependent methyltransferase [Atribacterota bacterium]
WKFMLHNLEDEVKVKRQKGQRRWQIAQATEREGWQNWECIRSELQKEPLAQYWKWYLDFISKSISFKSEWKIIDIGCGPDGIINYIPVGERFGLDPLMDFYLSDFELPTDIKWIAGTMEDIPFNSDYFDIVITTNALDHCLEPKKGLREVHRVLRKGGSLILTTNCYAPLRRFLRLAKEKVGMGDKPHPYSFSEEQIKSMINEEGFTLLANHKNIGTMGEWFLEEKKVSKFNIIKRLENTIFWLEIKIFGYSCIDFIFIATKG